ncbi:MAG TPA: pirin family protein [Methylococcus sp.]|nr:pirin family protein [Methylococcus sp.]
MSAGTGVQHSEYNPSAEEPVHFLQIWLQPDRQGVAPGYAQRHFPAEERRGRLRLLVSPDGRDGSISAHQDGLLYGTLLDAGEHELGPGRRGYVHVARGSVVVNGQALRAPSCAPSATPPSSFSFSISRPFFRHLYLPQFRVQKNCGRGSQPGNQFPKEARKRSL